MNLFYRCFTRFNCLNFIFLLLMLSFFIALAVKPLAAGFFGKEQIFFGKPSMIRESPLWSGSGVPVLDKLTIHINDDKFAQFVIYFSKEQNERLLQWFHTWGEAKLEMLPLEIHANRIAEDTWIVTSIASPEGNIEKSEFSDFHLRTVFWFSAASLTLFFIALFCISKYRSFFRYCYWFRNELREPKTLDK